MRGMHEAAPVPDVFVSGLGAIEKVGGNCLRFYLYTLQTPDGSDGPQEKVIVAKLIVPVTAIPDAVMQMIAVVGNQAIQLIPLVGDLVH
jgi:hypothetical protein